MNTRTDHLLNNNFQALQRKLRLVAFAAGLVTFLHACVFAAGPSGNLWPSKIPTPHPGNRDSNIVFTVKPEWSEIVNVLENLTDDQVDKGVLILVKPGFLKGNGVSSRNKPVLKRLGSESWSKRVTIAPRDGFGTVTMSKIRVLLVHNVCLSGFIIKNSLKIEGCNGFAMAQIQYDGLLQFYGFDWIPVIKNTELYELVNVKSETHNGDLMQIGTQGSSMEDLTIAGCYLVPHYFENGLQPEPHTDAIQFFPRSGQHQKNFEIIDSVLFASNNAAIQTGGIDGLLIKGSVVIGSGLSRRYYPITEGGSSTGRGMAVNGSGQNLRAIDSIFYGSVQVDDRFTPKPWSYTENCVVSYDWNDKYKAPAMEGKWIVNEDWDFYKSNIPEEPTTPSLISLWGGTTPPPPPPHTQLPTTPSDLRTASL